MIKFKIDIVKELSGKGLTTSAVQRTCVIPPSTWAGIKKGQCTMTMSTLSRLCALLDCQPEQLIYYAPDEETSAKVELFRQYKRGQLPNKYYTKKADRDSGTQ